MNDYFQQLAGIVKTQSKCTETGILQLRDLFEVKDFGVNDHFFQIEERNRKIGFICDGVLRAYILDENGAENNLFFSTTNNFIIGNLSPEMECSFNKQALTDSVLLVADYQKYHDLINTNKQLQGFHENILYKIHNKIRDRISKDFFSNASRKYSQFLKDYPGLLDRIPHYQVANYLGITPTQLSRVRRGFQE